MSSEVEETKDEVKTLLTSRNVFLMLAESQGPFTLAGGKQEWSRIADSFLQISVELQKHGLKKWLVLNKLYQEVLKRARATVREHDCKGQNRER